jgi:2-C-methyl-D-erythritol 4-phosphate cytidylyltransferase
MNVAIVVAAGKGTRLGGDRPKQFLELGGIPIIIHTLRQFERSREIDEVIAVLPPDEVNTFLPFAREFDLPKLARAVPGGATRAQSVLAGLSSITEAEVVAVHDGVRPLVSPAEIDRVMQTARAQGAAILTAPVADTIKEINGSQVVGTLPRAVLRRALTPQCFRFEILTQAYDKLAQVEAEGIEVTDDSFLVERLGISVTSVEGSGGNIKITREEDLVLAEAILKQRA